MRISLIDFHNLTYRLRKHKFEESVTDDIMELIKVTDIKQFDTYYNLKCQPDAINWSGFSSAPNKDKLFKHFLNKIINNNMVLVYYFEDNSNILGYIQVTILSSDTVEFSATNIFKEYQGQGYLQDMTTLLIEEMKKCGYKKIIGWASEHNKPVEYNLLFHDFRKLDEFEDRNLPLLGGDHRFYKWIRDL